MSIQSTFNQGLALVGMLASQSPELKIRAEERAKIASLERKAALQNQEFQSMSDALNKKGRYAAARRNISKEQIGQDLEDLGARAVETEEELFELEPSVKRYMQLGETRDRYNKISEINQRYAEKKEAVIQASQEAAMARQDEISRSREIARLITEDIPNISFDWRTYEPPSRKENE